MRKLTIICTLLLVTLTTYSQLITAEDGTAVHINSEDYRFSEIRKGSAGVVVTLDAFSGTKLLNASYLKPQVFHANASAGLDNISVEGTVFLFGYSREKNRKVSLLTNGSTYYVYRPAIEKRNDFGLYVRFTDFGNLLEHNPKYHLAEYDYSAINILYFGVSTVGYWNVNINHDNDIPKRGHVITRAVLAGFKTFNSTPKNADIGNDVPLYGLRGFYEFSATRASKATRKVKGRLNIVLRIGGELGYGEAKKGIIKGIVGAGGVYNFN